MRCLIIDALHSDAINLLLDAGISIADKRPDKSELIKIIGNYDALLLRSRIEIDQAVLSATTQLKFIGRAGAGLENIDVDLAKKNGIVVANSPKGNRDAVAEHAIGMLLGFLHNVNKSQSEVKKGIWRRKENWGRELAYKTVGIVGLGNTGSAFAKRLQCFGCKVLAYDKYKHNTNLPFVKAATLAEIQKFCDVISLHIPYNKETHYFVDAAFIDNCKKKPIIINTSRGSCLNTANLLNALDKQQISGALLDVHEYENIDFDKSNVESCPLALQRLINHPKIVLTPHIAGWSYESFKKISVFIAKKLIAFAKIK